MVNSIDDLELSGIFAALLSILRLASVLRTSALFREVRVRGFQHRILIPVSELALHGSIASLTLLFLFHSALKAVLVHGMSHNETSWAGIDPCLYSAYYETVKMAWIIVMSIAKRILHDRLDDA